jgi:7-keto-8-aminopelargonate synthetase-like enzyme
MGSLEGRVTGELRALDRRGLRRTLRAPAGIDLSSNDYLGLADHPVVKQRMIDAIEHGGCGSTGSRLLRGDRDAFASVERAFASFKGAERALFFSSGYLANVAVLTTFPTRGDLIVSDRSNHASLRDGARLSQAKRVAFAHNDATALSRIVGEHRGPAWTATCRLSKSTRTSAGRRVPCSLWTKRTPSASLVPEAAD